MSVQAERWLPVVGWEGLYEVSDHGSVRSIFMRKGARLGLLKPYKQSPAGHVGVSLHRDGKRTQAKIHTLVTTAFVGPKPIGLETRHLDGDPTNNFLDNLVYGTRSENNLDRVRHGTDHNTSKTHCPKGHEYTDNNTYHHPGGTGRTCRACNNEAVKAYQKRRAAGLPLG